MPPSPGLVRPRLLRQLDQVLAGRVALLVAGPGHGKTTLAAQWAHRAPVDVVWVRVEPQLRDVLIAHVGAAVHQLMPHRPPAEDLEELISTVARHDSPMVIVVDNVEMLPESAVAELQQLAVRGPARLRLLLCSRSLPPFNVASIELPTLTIDGPELAFRGDEIAELFEDHVGLRLSRDDVTRIRRGTGGWAAALQLLRAGVRDRTPATRARVLGELQSPVRYAKNYVDQEVLVGVPVALVEFLLHTSLLERLDARRCDTLLGTSHSHLRLRELADCPGLAERDGRGALVVVHPVLRAHLLTELLDEHGESFVRSRFREAGRLLEREGAHAEAARAMAAALDWGALSDHLHQHGREVLADTRTDWLDAVPPAVARDHPWLHLCHAARATRDGALTAACNHLITAEPLLNGGADRQEWELLDRQVRTWLFGDLQPGSSTPELIRAALRNPAIISEPHDHPEGALLRVLAEIMTGNFVAADEELVQAIGALREDSVGALAGSILFAALGRPDPNHLADIAAQAETLGLPWLTRMASALARAQRAAAPREELDDSLLLDHVADAESRGDDWGALLIGAIRATVRLAKGCTDPPAFEDLVNRCRALDVPVLESWARAGLALSSAALDLPDASNEGESAASFAIACSVPGAAAVAYGALALAHPANRNEYLAMAEAEAARAGLNCRPWSWVAPEEVAAPVTVTDRANAPLFLTCFGEFTLEVDGRAPELLALRPRARTLLRMLATRAGAPVHREVLTESLWPGLDEASGRHNLHVAISSLRSCLEPGSLRGRSRLVAREGERYRLHLPEGSYCDLVTFDAAVQRADQARAAGDQSAAMAALEVAVRIYQADVLPSDGPAEWVTPIRERYRLAMAEASAQLAELHLARGQSKEAVSYALRSIAADGCRDASWRLLLEAHEAAGDVAAAEHAHRAYVEVLTSLGVVSDTVHTLLPD